jgi:hypothetical protein
LALIIPTPAALDQDPRSAKVRACVSGVFLLLGGWFLFRNKPAGPYFLTASVVLVLFGFVAPSALEIVYIAWMSLAFTMGLLRNHTFTGKDIEKSN